MAVEFQQQPLDGRAGIHVSAGSLSFAAALEAWREDLAFTDAFTGVIAQSPYPALFFETPPLNLANVERPFEFVLIDAPALARRPASPRAFEAKLRPDQPCVTFANLGKDATLVCPCDQGAPADYAHLASFTRTAGKEQQRALWRATAVAVLAALESAPRWLSSSGLGVPWLHLRIDERPKYYVHRAYRAWPG